MGNFDSKALGNFGNNPTEGDVVSVRHRRKGGKRREILGDVINDTPETITVEDIFCGRTEEKRKIYRRTITDLITISRKDK